MAYEVRIKRIYEAPSPDDGYRVLVDRLWPRGVSKVRAALDAWDKTQVPPSTQLREWFGHDPAKFDAFRAQYLDELDERPEAHEFVRQVADLLQHENVTLLYAAKDPACNHAVILESWIKEQLAKQPR